MPAHAARRDEQDARYRARRCRRRQVGEPNARAVGTVRGSGRMAANAVALGMLAAACGASSPSPASPTAPRCPTDRVVLASQADVARIAGCTTLRDVTIRTGAPLDTSVLRSLATITGDLIIGPTVGMQDVTLGELRAVDGTIHVISNGLMQGLFLPRLERAGRIEIDGNVAVTTISLPRLATVRGALRITDNASLELVDVPVLVSIEQELRLTGDPQLALVEATQLRAAASVQLDLPRLPAEIAAKLGAVAASP